MVDNHPECEESKKQRRKSVSEKKEFVFLTEAPHRMEILIMCYRNVSATNHREDILREDMSDIGTGSNAVSWSDSLS